MTDRILKPCPFCGEETLLDVFVGGKPDRTGCRVCCGGCGAVFETDGGESESELAEAWNRRAEGQKARLLSAEEARELPEGSDIWIEELLISGRTRTTAATLGTVGRKNHHLRPLRWEKAFAWMEYNLEGWGGWRAWTARPTREQMDAAQWEGGKD